MSDIKKKIGNFSFVDTAAGQYAINMNWSQSMSQFFDAGTQDWDGEPVTVAGVRVVPWGPDNNMPNAIRDLLEKNNLGPGILDRKTGLLYGQGPMLYRVRIENNERIQDGWRMMKFNSGWIAGIIRNIFVIIWWNIRT